MRCVAAVVLALALAGCAVEGTPVEPAYAASPQTARLHWTEAFGERGNRTVFRVDRFAVLSNGWEAAISITNGTRVSLAVGDPEAALERVFGVMLFRTGLLDELERRNRDGDLPAVRHADEIEPPLPLVLEPGDTWRGTIRADGSLAAGRFVRIVFGSLVPVGPRPKGYPPQLVWITDHAYALKR